MTTFQCSQCGHCCNTWRIPIDATRADALLALDWVQSRLKSEGMAFEPLNDWGYFLPLKSNNECVFWDETHHCLIHHHEGANAKPLDCQRFPFARLPLPDATHPPVYDVSAACSMVAKQHLFDWKKSVQPAELEEHATASQELPSPFHPTQGQQHNSYARYPFPFQGIHRLNREAFTGLMHERVMPLLQSEALTPWQALHQVQGVMFPQLPFVPQNDYPSEASTHRILSTWLRSEYGRFPRWEWRFLGRYQDARLFGTTVIHREDLARIQMPESLLFKYAKPFLFHLLRRESPLLYGSSLWHSVVVAKIAYVLLVFYSKAFTLQCEEDCVSEETLELAIRCIERYYTAHQPRFLARVEANPHLALAVYSA